MNTLDIYVVRFLSGMQLLLWSAFLVMLVWKHETSPMMGGICLVVMNALILYLTFGSKR